MTMVNPDRLSTPMYRNTRLKKVLAQLAIPVFGLLNRPALRWWAEAWPPTSSCVTTSRSG